MIYVLWGELQWVSCEGHVKGGVVVKVCNLE